tara:strand:+ start:5469 stop:6515 length:1047 start_codon:yes stop_codon:yes gene_type:complete
MGNNVIEKFKKNVINNPDLSFAFFIAISVYVFFSFSIENYATHNLSFAILERFAVLGLVGLALTICIIAGEIDLSIGSNAALCAVIVVKLTDPIGAPLAMLIGISISTLIGFTQGFFIAFLRVRAIVLTVGTLMLLRGISLVVAEEKTVMLTDFRVPDFITTKFLMYFSPASIMVIFVFILVGIFMRFTKYGREIYAIGGARKESLAAGVPLKRPMMIAFALSGFCAGFAGTVIGLKSGTAQGLGLQYLLLAGTVAAFVGGVSILGGKGGVIGAAVGSLTVNFLNTGLVFFAMQVHFVQFFTSVLLVVVIIFQTMSRIFDNYQTRKSYLMATDLRSKILLEKKRKFLT